MIPGTGSSPRKEAPEENCISTSKSVPGLEERIAIMRKRSIVNQVVDEQERDDQNTVAAAKEMERQRRIKKSRSQRQPLG